MQLTKSITAAGLLCGMSVAALPFAASGQGVVYSLSSQAAATVPSHAVYGRDAPFDTDNVLDEIHLRTKLSNLIKREAAPVRILHQPERTTKHDTAPVGPKSQSPTSPADEDEDEGLFQRPLNSRKKVDKEEEDDDDGGLFQRPLGDRSKAENAPSKPPVDGTRPGQGPGHKEESGVGENPLPRNWGVDFAASLKASGVQNPKHLQQPPVDPSGGNVRDFAFGNTH